MNDRDGSEAPTQRSRERLRDALAAAIDRYGPGLLSDPARLKLQLDVACPDAGADITRLLTAAAQRVPQQLLRAPSDDAVVALLPRLTDALVKSGVDRPSAAWTVRSWAFALALPIAPTTRSTPRSTTHSTTVAAATADASRDAVAAVLAGNGTARSPLPDPGTAPRRVTTSIWDVAPAPAGRSEPPPADGKAAADPASQRVETATAPFDVTAGTGPTDVRPGEVAWTSPDDAAPLATDAVQASTALHAEPPADGWTPAEETPSAFETSATRPGVDPPPATSADAAPHGIAGEAAPPVGAASDTRWSPTAPGLLREDADAVAASPANVDGTIDGQPDALPHAAGPVPIGESSRLPPEASDRDGAVEPIDAVAVARDDPPRAAPPPTPAAPTQLSIDGLDAAPATRTARATDDAAPLSNPNAEPTRDHAGEDAAGAVDRTAPEPPPAAAAASPRPADDAAHPAWASAPIETATKPRRRPPAHSRARAAGLTALALVVVASLAGGWMALRRSQSQLQMEAALMRAAGSAASPGAVATTPPAPARASTSGAAPPTPRPVAPPAPAPSQPLASAAPASSPTSRPDESAQRPPAGTRLSPPSTATPSPAAAAPTTGAGAVVATAPSRTAVAPPAASTASAARAPSGDATSPSRPATSSAHAITRIDVPRIATGRPFSVALALAPAAADGVAIERRVVDGNVRWREPLVVVPASSLARSRRGALLYPLDAFPSGGRATVQFTPIARDGTRGTPTRVALRAEAAPERPAAAACTRASCGTVVAVREATRGFEVIVRMDDRSIRAVPQPSRWRPGARVRVAGDQIVPAT